MAPKDYSYMKDYLNWHIVKKMRQNKVVGLSIAVVDDEKIIWSKGFGFSDRAGNKAADADTIYRIGSISKVFTAIGTMQLAEAGKLDPDAPIRTILPEFSIRSRFNSTDGITPATIMSHHAGLPCDVFKGWTSESDASLLTRLAEEYTTYPPRTISSYSNAGVSLLGLAISRIAGEDFSSHMDRAVFTPMGMHHTSFSLNPAIEKQLARGYAGKKEKKQLPIRDRAAGSVYSSVSDMSRFMQVILNQGQMENASLISAGTLARMTRPQNQGLPLDFGFQTGLGWCLDGFPVPGAKKVIWHNGGTFLFNSHMALLPEKKLGVIVLTNSAEGAAIVDDISIRALELAMTAKYGPGAVPAVPAETKEKRQTRFDPAQISKLVGDYGSPDGIFTIAEKGGRLFTDADGQRLRLVRYESGRIGVQMMLWGLFPISVKELDDLRFSLETVDHQDIIVLHTQGISFPLAKKIIPAPLPGAWAGMAGEYEVMTPDPDLNPQNIVLKVEEKALVLSMEIPTLQDELFEVYFQPVSSSDAVTLGIGRGAGETLRITDIGGHPGLHFSGFSFKKKTTL